MLQVAGDWEHEEDMHLQGEQGAPVLHVRRLETLNQRMHCRELEMHALRGARSTVGTQDGLPPPRPEERNMRNHPRTRGRKWQERRLATTGNTRP
jgi:hypothetical protein